MIKTKYCIMHKKHDLYEGFFKYKGIRVKVKAFKERDWDGDYILTEIYKFRKGRYEFLRSDGHTHHEQDIDNAVTYIIEKAISKYEIQKTNMFEIQIMKSLESNVNYYSNNGRIYPKDVLEKSFKKYFKKVKRGEINMMTPEGLEYHKSDSSFSISSSIIDGEK